MPTDIYKLFNNQELINIIEKNEQTKWFSKLNVGTLEILFWAIGEYGSTLRWMNGDVGEPPYPCFSEDLVGLDTISAALDNIAAIQNEIFDDSEKRFPFNKQLSDRPCFSVDRMTVVGRNCWIAGITESDFVCLLWFLGSYVNGLKEILHKQKNDSQLRALPYPVFNGGDDVEKNLKLQSLIHLFVRIVEGENITMSKAEGFQKQFIADHHPFMKILRNPQFVDELNYGKYSHWSVYLDGQTLQTLLWAIGVFGNCFASIKAAGEEQRSLTIDHARVSMALDTLFQIQQTGQTDFTMPSRWDRSFSEAKPILTNEFAKQLAEHDETIWAQNIHERELALVLWMIGEYSFRSSEISFFTDTNLIKKLQAALLILYEIFLGKRYTIATAQRMLDEILNRSG